MTSNAADEITGIFFLPPDTLLRQISTPLEQQFCEAVSAWLENKGRECALPFARCGTPFQNQVWQLIREIPRGRTCHYGELAARLDSSARAIGQACGDNPFPLFTPCHRVLGKQGGGGFSHADSGWLIQTKLWLLQNEEH
jgi:methylated-DNA-[protein]-cysteine S-methyltransferase